ncbi:hypothetical protein VHEMI05085 [[Torrubiella] hemipterigena]|uniref:Copper acquisition factor BIM1-like domain-containing protein n=1 Tax=[Torrubiella] hemipterigena TaxID=1531966 RepID=A0A0A1TFU6_9HYPO|nr:hypothetical protein VHEMI05085 [[Torrubiella] hemipterigena]
MVSWKSITLLAAAQSVTAHFGLTYPAWRADTLSSAGEAKYSQWTYPCAGVPYKAGNVTEWPLEGGQLQVELHHPWTYLFVNLGLGENATNFNISLTPQLTNTTGKGTLCLDKLPVPANIQDGTVGSIQVVTSGSSGSALYNCADIKFSKNAKKLDVCNSTGVTASVVQAGASTGNSSTGGAAKPETGKGAATALGTNTVALGSVVGLAAAFALGLGL